MPHLLSVFYPKLELKMYFGPVVNLLGRRELSGQCETKRCCHVSGFVCLSPIMCSAISAAPGVQAVVICVVSVEHPCLATKEHQQQALQKLSLGIFREEPDSCAIKTLVIKLYIATSFFQSDYEETIHCACSGRSEFSVWDDCKSGCSYPGFRDS